MHRASFMFAVSLATIPSMSLADTWVGDVSGHRLGCTDSTVNVSDIAAVTSIAKALSGLFTAAGIIPGATEPAPGSTPTNFRLCMQLGDEKLPNNSHITEVAVSKSPAILSLCLTTDSKCQENLSTLLGANWKERIYAVPIYRWTNSSGAVVDVSPTQAYLALVAAGIAPIPHEANPDDKLSRFAILLVAPAPAGMNAVDLQAKLTSVAPVAPLVPH